MRRKWSGSLPLKLIPPPEAHPSCPLPPPHLAYPHEPASALAHPFLSRGLPYPPRPTSATLSRPPNSHHSSTPPRALRPPPSPLPSPPISCPPFVLKSSSPSPPGALGFPSVDDDGDVFNHGRQEQAGGALPHRHTASPPYLTTPHLIITRQRPQLTTTTNIHHPPPTTSLVPPPPPPRPLPPTLPPLHPNVFLAGPGKDLEWTIVRPGGLKDDPPNGIVNVISGEHGRMGGWRRRWWGGACHLGGNRRVVGGLVSCGV